MIKKCLDSGYNSWVIDGSIVPISSDAFSVANDPLYDFSVAKDFELLFVRSSSKAAEIWVHDFIYKVAASVKSLMGSELLSREHRHFVYFVSETLRQNGVRLKEVDEMSFGVKIGINPANQTSLGDGKKMVFWSSEVDTDYIQRGLENLGMWVVDDDSSCTAVVCHES